MEGDRLIMIGARIRRSYVSRRCTAFQWWVRLKKPTYQKAGIRVALCKLWLGFPADMCLQSMLMVYNVYT